MRHFQVPRVCRHAKGVQRVATGGKEFPARNDRNKSAGTRRNRAWNGTVVRNGERSDRFKESCLVGFVTKRKCTSSQICPYGEAENLCGVSQGNTWI